MPDPNDLLKKLDDLVKQEKFETRSQAIQNAVEEKIMKEINYHLSSAAEFRKNLKTVLIV